jgi:hypothetical protein
MRQASACGVLASGCLRGRGPHKARASGWRSHPVLIVCMRRGSHLGGAAAKNDAPRGQARRGMIWTLCVYLGSGGWQAASVRWLDAAPHGRARFPGRRLPCACRAERREQAALPRGRGRCVCVSVCVLRRPGAVLPCKPPLVVRWRRPTSRAREAAASAQEGCSLLSVAHTRQWGKGYWAGASQSRQRWRARRRLAARGSAAGRARGAGGQARVKSARTRAALVWGVGHGHLRAEQEHARGRECSCSPSRGRGEGAAVNGCGPGSAPAASSVLAVQRTAGLCVLYQAAAGPAALPRALWATKPAASPALLGERQNQRRRGPAAVEGR